MDYGTCRPKGPFPKDKSQENRSFSGVHCNMVSKAGLSVEVSWLAYSPILDSAYCELCWFFADRTNPHYNRAWSTDVRKTVADLAQTDEAFWSEILKRLISKETAQLAIGAIKNWRIGKPY